jgi:hypothetical protein
MQIDCPRGYKAIVKIGPNLSFEDGTVTILGGVCECSHQCGIAVCPFYDVSPQGDARYLVALKQAHSLEALLEERTAH